MCTSISTRRGWPILRLLTMFFAVAVAMATVASPAAADGPTKTEFEFSFSDVFTTVCPFPITISGDLRVTQIEFVDQSGVLTRTSWHVAQQDTFSANGQTLVGLPYTYHAIFLYDSAGNLTSLISDGLVEKVPLPDGGLFISAGKVDFGKQIGFTLSADPGNPGNIAAFCAALAP